MKGWLLGGGKRNEVGGCRFLNSVIEGSDHECKQRPLVVAYLYVDSLQHAYSSGTAQF